MFIGLQDVLKIGKIGRYNMFIIDKFNGYYGIWDNQPGYKKYNPISPLFINKKQAINWLVKFKRKFQ